jgi:hypothetical protein
MANSNWNKKDAGTTSSSREESSGEHGTPRGSEGQGDGFDTGGGNNKGDKKGASDSGSTGLGGEKSSGEGSSAGGVEGTSTRDGRTGPDESRR